jgi:hypothetical protein
MASLILLPVQKKLTSGTYLLYDPTCGTGGMLTEADFMLQKLAQEAKKEVNIHLYGQEVNPETYAICKSDLLIRGEEEGNIRFGSTLSNDAFPRMLFDLLAQHVKPPAGAEGLRTRVDNNDVLVCITGALTGNVLHVEEQPPEGYINQHVALLRPKHSQVAPRYLAYALWSGVGQDQFRMAQYGGTKQGLGLQDVLSVVIPHFPIAQQTKVVKMLDEISGGVARAICDGQRHITLMEEYRMALISAAVTGRIGVRGGYL